MKRIYLGLALTALLSPALAADLPPFPTKAAVVAPCLAGSCSGWYGGFGFAGSGSNLDIVAGGLNNSVFAAGGIVKVQGGYQLWNGSWFAAIDVSLGGEFTTTANGSLPVVPNERGRSKLFGSEMIRLGYNFFPSPASAPVTPSQSPISGLIVPANLLAASTPFLQCGGVQRRGTSVGACGAGFETVIASSWTSTISYTNSPSQQGLPADNLVMIEINKHF